MLITPKEILNCTSKDLVVFFHTRHSHNLEVAISVELQFGNTVNLCGFTLRWL